MTIQLSIGARVTGTYLGHPVSGVVKNLESATDPRHKRYWVVLDEPVDVAKSEHMTAMRQNLQMTMDLDGHTVNHKGERDGIGQIRAEN